MMRAGEMSKSAGNAVMIGIAVLMIGLALYA